MIIANIQAAWRCARKSPLKEISTCFYDQELRSTGWGERIWRSEHWRKVADTEFKESGGESGNKWSGDVHTLGLIWVGENDDELQENTPWVNSRCIQRRKLWCSTMRSSFIAGWQRCGRGDRQGQHTWQPQQQPRQLLCHQPPNIQPIGAFWKTSQPGTSYLWAMAGWVRQPLLLQHPHTSCWCHESQYGASGRVHISGNFSCPDWENHFREVFHLWPLALLLRHKHTLFALDFPLWILLLFSPAAFPSAHLLSSPFDPCNNKFLQKL